MKSEILLLGLGFIFMVSCNLNNSDKDTEPVIDPVSEYHIPDGFDFSTTKTYNASIYVKTSGGEALPYVDVTIGYNQDQKVFSAFSNKDGLVSGTFSLPSYVEEVQLITRFPGLPDTISVALNGNAFSYVYNSDSEVATKAGESFSTKASSTISGFYTLGSWDYYGRPGYLTNSDAISPALLADINASLPESSPLTATHPQYLTSNASATIHLGKECDVWVTFVHEGASYKNVLGFYSYAAGNAPASANDIPRKTIIFPNVSYPYSGGNLSSGSKVYLGRFNADTNIDWFLVADGFKDANRINTSPVYYSDDNFNPESSPDKKKHVVVLYDTQRDLALLSFEDVNRETGRSDNDFNDAIFYVTANPVDAIDKAQYVDRGQVVDTPKDTDNDGVSDSFDDYPNDPYRAKLVTTDTYSTLAFEDYWPKRGDYDFNDLVLDYKFNYIINASNQVKDIKPTVVIRAVGASYHNGFGIQFPFTSDVVSGASGQTLTKGMISVNGNGMEAGQSKAVLVVFDDVFGALKATGNNFLNTQDGGTTMPADTINLNITLGTPQTLTATAPFNPFIFIKGNRSREVHLANHEPTDLADESYFSTENDKSVPSSGIYYISTGNLPWAINVAESFSYPLETVDITDTYNYFVAWAESGGNSYADWFRDLTGYRNSPNIY